MGPSGAWSTAAPITTRRDNAGSAVLDGKLYVFGGRTRNADGSTVPPSGGGTLTSTEAFDPGTGIWEERAPMPTGRRSMVVGTLRGRAQLIGGERKGASDLFSENEEYDVETDSWRTLTPMLTPRHGAAAGTIGETIYVASGGATAGTAFSSINEAFSFSESSTPGPPPDNNPPPPPEPLNTFGFGKLKLNKKNGTATLPIEAPGSGQLLLSGKGVNGGSARAVASPGTVKLTVRAKGKSAKALKRKGKVKLKVNVTFTPTGGAPNTETKDVTLKRN